MTSLASINSRIVACRRCPRLRAYCAQVARDKRAAYRDETYWGRPVPGFGDPLASLLVVGLAPGAHGANRTGRLFTGDSSADFLARALHRAGFASQPFSRNRDDGLTLSGAYISAAARCAPPGNRPTPAELESCLPYLASEMAALPRVTVVVALGRIAFDAVLRALGQRGASVGPQPVFGHARRYEFAGACPAVIASYHPSRQNTNTRRLTEEMFDDVFDAARRLTRPDARR